MKARKEGSGGSPTRAGTIQLREMSKADIPRIMALEQELFPEDAWTPEMFAGEFAQPASRRLYLRNGFTEIGIRRGYYQPSGVDAVVMRKVLAR